ncbi:UPF0496 protein At2g18630-like [Cornus florida]|uniref:UPF0496 protein At2g18630-like n=1 Tax=Cornus florida TaxID=4283 RepID=UPI0028A0DC9D|nr:UPF0496 protein At2g18630-like [Cornus florida]
MGLLGSKIREEDPYSESVGPLRVINTLGVGVKGGSLSVESLGELTDRILETKQQVVEFIDECKELKDVWWNEDGLLDLVVYYVGNTMQFIELCTALNQCLVHVKVGTPMIQATLKKFEEGQKELGLDEKREIYLTTVQELKNYKTVGHPLIQKFFLLFQSVYTKQMLMFKTLKAKKSKFVKKWKKLTFVVAFASVMMFSVVAAVGNVVMVLMGATTAMGQMDEWIDSLWNQYEDLVKGHKETAPSLLKIENRIEMGDLEDCIGALVLKNADFDVSEEDGVTVAMDEIKKRLREFLQTIEKLYEHTTKLSTKIMSGWKEGMVILRNINDRAYMT